VKRTLVTIAVVAAAFIFAASALGGSSIVTGHSATPSASSNLGVSGSHSGTLPYTGLDLAGIVVVAALLVGGGLILSRTNRRT
jgi:hypothetical protein